MNTALSWIKAYVPDLDVTAQEYTDAMTLSGTKVEGYEKLDKNLEKIVVGQILSIEKPTSMWAIRFRWYWTAARWREAMTAARFRRTGSASKPESSGAWSPAA